MAHRFCRNRARLAVDSLESRLAPAVFVVTSPIDTGPGSIREAVAHANALAGPDLIRFEIPTLQPGPNIITLTAGEIAITDSVTIVGSHSLTPTPIPHTSPSPMIIFNGNHASRIFNINGPNVLTVNLYGLGLTAGSTSEAGGAVLNVGENVNFFGCTLTDNVAAGNGGAVETIAVTPGAVTNRAVQVTFSNSRATGNHAADGGAFHVTGPGLLMVESSSLNENRSAAKGGAIAFANGGRVSIENSTLANNSAGTAGGGLSYTGGPHTVPPVSAVDTPVLVRNSTFSANSAQVNGGAIALASFGNSVLMIANSTVTRNTAGVNSPILTNAGGGIHVAASSNTSDVGRIALVSSVVSQNQATFGPDVFTPGTLGATFSALGSASGIGTYMDRGHNLAFGIDVRLGPLQNNGGPTLTHMPAANSPLLEHGNNPYQLRFDQRGRPFHRIVGRRTDIGAVERELMDIVAPPPREIADIESRTG